MTELDLTALKCPLPALRARKALRGLAPGGALVVTCDDPMAAIDIPHMAREEGGAILEQTRSGATLRFVIRARSGA